MAQSAGLCQASLSNISPISFKLEPHKVNWSVFFFRTVYYYIGFKFCIQFIRTLSILTMVPCILDGIYIPQTRDHSLRFHIYKSPSNPVRNACYHICSHNAFLSNLWSIYSFHRKDHMSNCSDTRIYFDILVPKGLSDKLK